MRSTRRASDFRTEDEFKQLQAGDTSAFTGFRLPGTARPRGLVVRWTEKLALVA